MLARNTKSSIENTAMDPKYQRASKKYHGDEGITGAFTRESRGMKTTCEERKGTVDPPPNRTLGSMGRRPNHALRLKHRFDVFFVRWVSIRCFSVRWVFIAVVILPAGCPKPTSTESPPPKKSEQASPPPASAPSADSVARSAENSEADKGKFSRNAAPMASGKRTSNSESPSSPANPLPKSSSRPPTTPSSTQGKPNAPKMNSPDSKPIGSEGKKQTPSALKSTIVEAHQKYKSAKQLADRGKSEAALVAAIEAIEQIPATIEIETCTGSDADRAGVQRGAENVRRAIEKLLAELEADGTGVVMPGKRYPGLKIK